MLENFLMEKKNQGSSEKRNHLDIPSRYLKQKKKGPFLVICKSCFPLENF